VITSLFWLHLRMGRVGFRSVAAFENGTSRIDSVAVAEPSKG
jgi:hypothetical protein